MTPKRAAEMTGIPYGIIITALRAGALRGRKIRGRWYIKPRTAYRFGWVNQKKIEKLSAKYVELYWQGLTVAQLQSRVKEDFRRYGVVWKAAGFAEQVIYQSVMEERGEKQ